MATIKFMLIEEETGDEIEVALPAKNVVCSRCDGEGKHVNPAVDGNGISQEEFDQDPDFEEAYRSGRYDVQCLECKGNKVVKEVDHVACKFQGLEMELKAYYRQRRDLREVDAIYRAEREMGA